MHLREGTIQPGVPVRRAATIELGFRESSRGAAKGTIAALEIVETGGQRLGGPWSDDPCLPLADQISDAA